MRPLGCLGIGLSLVSGCLFLAVVAQLYYFFWWKKRKIDGDLFCWKKSSFSSSADLNPQEICVSVIGAIPSAEEQLDSNSTRDLLWKPFGEEDTVEAELMRLHRLAGPPRSLCTITEETQQDLVSEDVRYRVGKSLRDLLLIAESPILTPLSSPPFFSSSPTPMACYSQNGFNPLFEPSDEDGLTWIWSSPPPKLKFLKDAEEKLYRKTLLEEELKDHSSSGSMKNKDIIEACAPSLSPVATSSPKGPEEQNGFFITTVTKTTPAIRRHQKDLYLPSPWSARQTSMHVVDAAATAATVVANALRRKKRQSVVSERARGSYLLMYRPYHMMREQCGMSTEFLCHTDRKHLDHLSQNHGGRRSKSTQHSNSCSIDYKINSERKCSSLLLVHAYSRHNKRRRQLKIKRLQEHKSFTVSINGEDKLSASSAARCN